MVLHGGDKFTKSVKVTPEVLETFRSVIGLGPLHMPANIMELRDHSMTSHVSSA